MGHRTLNNFYRRLVAVAVCGLLSLTAWSDEVAITAEVAAEVQSADALQDAMRKVGEARLKVLLWSVYDSRLYTPSGNYDDGDLPLRLEIQYLRDIRARDLVDRTLVEWEAMGREHPNQSAWLKQLSGLWPDIAASDVLTLELDRNSVATFSHNGEVLGRLEDPDFGQQFVDIWLSRDCTRPSLRDQLIGAVAAAD